MGKFKLNKAIEGASSSPTLAINDKVMQKRQNGEVVFHMGFGQAPFSVPDRLQVGAKNNVNSNRYTSALGIPELREAALNYHCKIANLDKNNWEAVIAPGSKILIYAIQQAVEGDLIFLTPSWVSYIPQAKLLGDEVIKFEVQLGEYYHVDVDALRKLIHHSRKEGKNPSKIILNYPNNPTGLTISDKNLQEIAQLCIKENLLIISDEIYGLVNFEGNYRSIAKYAPENTIVTTGLSKHLSLGGWRVGVGLIPKNQGLTEALDFIGSELWSCNTSLVQKAVIDAYKAHNDIETVIKNSAEIHKIVMTWVYEKLTTAGIICHKPQGAFYLFPDFINFKQALAKLEINNSTELSEYLLEKYSVSSVAGAAFGVGDPNLCIRIAGCDYDGEKAMQSYVDNKPSNCEKFIETNCNNVYKGTLAMVELVESLK